MFNSGNERINACLAYKEEARIKVATTPIHAQPVLASNGIFIKDQDSVTFWGFE